MYTVPPHLKFLLPPETRRDPAASAECWAGGIAARRERLSSHTAPHFFSMFSLQGGNALLPHSPMFLFPCRIFRLTPAMQSEVGERSLALLGSHRWQRQPARNTPLPDKAARTSLFLLVGKAPLPDKGSPPLLFSR